MDTRPKRKLRSAKELTEDGNKDEEPHSDPGSSSRVETEAAEIPTTPSKEDEVTSGCSTSHRPKESQSSAVQDSGEHKQPNITPTKERDDDCTCSLCDFVAKTPTALKIHAKRKHFRRGGGSRSESAQGRKTNKEVSKAVSVTAKRRDDKKSSQHEEHNPQATVTLTSLQQDVSAVADCKDSGLPPPGEAVSSEEQTESTESRHVSPTQLLLEMVDPSAGGTGQVLDGKEMSSTEEIREHGESQTKSEPSSDTFKESNLKEGECLSGSCYGFTGLGGHFMLFCPFHTHSHTHTPSITRYTICSLPTRSHHRCSRYSPGPKNASSARCCFFSLPPPTPSHSHSKPACAPWLWLLCSCWY